MGFSKVLPNVHLSKDWQEKVRTFFNQPAKKLKRRQARSAKAKKLGPNPTHLLRPVVRGQTRRYNNKQKLGRGFTLEELKKAGVIGVNYARSLGIVVDLRRKDCNEETLKVNADRLKEYLNKMILHPRRGKVAKSAQKKEATEDQIKFAETQPQNTSRSVIPLPKPESAFSFTEINEKMKSEIVYKTLRKEWKEETGFNRKLEAKKKKAAEKASKKN